MEKKFGILSRHIVLCEHSYPIFGIIIIQGEVIQDLIMLDNSLTKDEIIAKYSLWNIVDYSDYYISPGVVDLNVRKEWESYETLTKAAISGGTTFILEEPQFFTSGQSYPELYCDVGKLKLISDQNLNTSSEGYLALKAYLFPPSFKIPPLCDIQQAVQISESLHLPLFIDPNLPEERMLYMASPLRLEKTEEHINKPITPLTNVYAAAFAHDNEDSGESESESDDMIEFRPGSLVEHEIDIFKSQTDFNIKKEEVVSRFSKGLQVPERRKKRSKSSTIIDDLNARIEKNTKNTVDLCNAESKTYNSSGNTSFIMPDSPEPKQNAKRRPPSITISSEKIIEPYQEYSFYLANCPEYWETRGINTVLSNISSTTSIHFQNISSAVAFNKIRKSSEINKKLTCEVSVPHLFFNSSDVAKGDTRLKSHPPIRNSSNFSLLWDLLKMKVINSISSQHVFVDYNHKSLNNGRFQNAHSGICSMGFTLLGVWTTISISITKKNLLDHYIVRLSKWLSLHPSKILGLNNCGNISKGKLANLTVWDPYARQSAEVLEEYQRVCPFNNKEIIGKIHKVYLRGNLAYDNGEYHNVGKRVGGVNA